MTYRRVPHNHREHHRPAKGWTARLRRTWKPIGAVITAVVTAVAVFYVNKWLESSSENRTPLTWSVRVPAPDPCVQHVVIGRSEQESVPPDRLSDFPGWAAKVKALPSANTSFTTITLQGVSTKAVVLHAMRVRVIKSSTPPQQAFTVGGACGGGIAPRMFEVTLDQPLPKLQASGGTTEVPGPSGQPVEKELPAIDFPYRISATEPEVFEIKANAGRCDCEWIVEIDWASDGKTGTVKIDDRGHPFRTISTEGKPGYIYDQGNQKWSRS